MPRIVFESVSRRLSWSTALERCHLSSLNSEFGRNIIQTCCRILSLCAGESGQRAIGIRRRRGEERAQCCLRLPRPSILEVQFSANWAKCLRQDNNGMMQPGPASLSAVPRSRAAVGSRDCARPGLVAGPECNLVRPLHFDMMMREERTV